MHTHANQLSIYYNYHRHLLCKTSRMSSRERPAKPSDLVTRSKCLMMKRVQASFRGAALCFALEMFESANDRIESTDKKD